MRGPAGEARRRKLIARDDRKNPLISTFDWTDEAAQRILRVPAGFMRNKTQERIEELARERAAAAIDLALVEEGIEIGKRMMAEMIATYPSQGKSPATTAPAARAIRRGLGAPAPEAQLRCPPQRERLSQRGERADRPKCVASIGVTTALSHLVRVGHPALELGDRLRLAPRFA